MANEVDGGYGGKFEALRRRVLDEVQKERARAQQAHPPPGVLFGLFLQACLQNMGETRADFAERADLEPELADAILDGLFPASEIDNGLLEQIAGAVDYDPALLALLLTGTPDARVTVRTSPRPAART